MIKGGGKGKRKIPSHFKFLVFLYSFIKNFINNYTYMLRRIRRTEGEDRKLLKHMFKLEN